MTTKPDHPLIKEYEDLAAKLEKTSGNEEKKAHKAQACRILKKIPSDVYADWKRWQRRDVYKEENRKVDAQREEVSPSGKYKLLIDYYRTCSENAKRCTWDFTRGQVFSVDSDQPIATVYRNYSSFWHCWATDHKTGNEYLFCGEDYQGLSRVDCQTGEVKHTFPEEAKSGFGWCHRSMLQSPSGKYLAAEGCFWGGSDDVRIYKFDPEVFPPEKHTWIDSVSDFDSWGEDDDTLVFKKDWEGIQVNGQFYLDPFTVRAGLVSPDQMKRHGWKFATFESHDLYDGISDNDDDYQRYWSWREASILWSIDGLLESTGNWKENWEKNLEPIATVLPGPRGGDLERIDDDHEWANRFVELAQEDFNACKGGLWYALNDFEDYPNHDRRIALLKAMHEKGFTWKDSELTRCLQILSGFKTEEVAEAAKKALEGAQ